ncbi:YdcF family protein [Bifidobacterium oedipodis]|uniref:DUF218 domain-containing protein n=1 Tax=Bifidobacterium oedipodis TaxID=2675322 RepID=A0A7Y0EQC2_9BIFI|nr:YdcF family protein [Bifidobacterium sp. DSM 109957]NMM94467.1 hypothetical protein [Bifidobacterium sp. DSM 109957]
MGTIGSRVVFGICIVLAVACAAYSMAVLGTHSGTSFWMVWLVFAALFALLGFSFLLHWWALLPKMMRNVIVTVLILGVACFGVVEARIIAAMNTTAGPGLDYVIVLGAQVRESGPSRVLRYRLNTAIDYLNDNPKTICVVSGGQGANEPFPEAQGMTEYLEEHGISADRILEESKSTTTEENIRYSLKLLDKASADGGQSTADASVGLVTNNFHMFRALQIAHVQGLPQAQGLPAGSPPDMLVNNMVREFFAEIKFLLRSLAG